MIGENQHQTFCLIASRSLVSKEAALDGEQDRDVHGGPSPVFGRDLAQADHLVQDLVLGFLKQFVLPEEER